MWTPALVAIVAGNITIVCVWIIAIVLLFLLKRKQAETT